MMDLAPKKTSKLIVYGGILTLTATLESTACFAEYSPAQNLFISLDPKYLEHINISEAARNNIIRSKFMIGIEICNQKEESIDPWYISRTTSTQLELKKCSNLEEILFRTYKSTPIKSIGLVAFIAGNHQQTQNLDFFKISSDREPQPIPAATLGLKPATENDFLDYKQKFSPKDNHQVPFLVEPESEAIQASPWTWMDPRWESKTIRWDIRYFWNGTRFERNKTLVTNPIK